MTQPSEAQPTWPVIVRVEQCYVVGVKAETADDALKTSSSRFQQLIAGQDPVSYEMDWHTPDPSERKAYADDIAFEIDDSNF